MNFSIILASRERVYLLDSLLSSIMATVGDKDNCEVICVLDNDDRVSRRFIDRFNEICPFAHFVFRERAKNLNDDYLNWAWKNYANGDNIIVMNDDVVFKTPNWDQIIMAKLSQYLADKPDGVAYGWIQDGLPSRAGNLNYCCFPLVTRKAAEAVGFVMPREFAGWGADIGLYRIYDAVNRVCDLSDVSLEHLSHHTGARSRDHINHGVEERSLGSAHPINGFNIGPYVGELLKSIHTNSTVNTDIITGATLTGVTVLDATIIDGRIVGGRVVNGKIEGGRIESGYLKSGRIEGDLQSGHVVKTSGVSLV